MRATFLVIAGLSGCFLADRDGDGIPDVDDCAPGARYDDCNNPPADTGETDSDSDTDADSDSDSDSDSAEDTDETGETGDTGTPCDSHTWYRDADGDGFGNSDSAEVACDQLSGYVSDDSDCDDADATSFPGAPERCDGADNDCDDEVDENVSETWYNDRDSDGYGNGDEFVETVCDGGQPWLVDNVDDCDDTDGSVNPGATEVCNDIDDDCDGSTDESDAADATTWYRDEDSDGYGDLADVEIACDQPSGYVSAAGDCDDLDSTVSPGATETCNGVDDNCDGSTDGSDSADATTWYADADEDGYGDPSTSFGACDQPTGYVSDDSDCDDGNADVSPGATETCNGVDDNCDGSTDGSDSADATGWVVDTDGDGHGDENLSSVMTACDQPSGYANVADDCDDADGSNYPGNAESCDGADNDCDGSAGADEVDADGDGLYECEGDCDDGNADVNPSAVETCNGVDDNCDGLADGSDATGQSTWYADADGDGYGDEADTATACDQPSGYVSAAGDCDDLDSTVSPGAVETCDGVDDNCDGATDESDALDAATWYRDEDEDDWGDNAVTEVACDQPAGYVADGGDCDENDDDVYPGAHDECGDGEDADCNGADDACADTASDEDDSDDSGDSGTDSGL